MRARVRKPDARRNPYDFDENDWLQANRIVGVAEPDSISIRHPVIDSGRWARAVKMALGRRIEETFTSKTTSVLYRAMILGERQALSDRLNEAFRKSGLSHLLAISGLHVAVLAMAVYLLAGWPLRILRIRGRTRIVARSLVVISLLYAYGFVVGWSASVGRAVLMTSMIAIAQSSGRRSSTWNTLFAAATLLLLLDPAQLTQAGFQLSFSAVAGILLFARPGPTSHGTVRTAVRQACLVSAAAGSATLPVLLFHFGRVSLASLLFSPLAVGLLTLGLPLVWLAILLPFPLSDPIAQVASFLGHSQIAMADAGAESRWIPVWWVDPGSFAASFFFPAIMLMSWILNPGRCRTWVLILAIFAGIWTVYSPLVRSKATLDVMILDVGQGDGIVARMPNGKLLIIDTGPGSRSARSLISHVEAWSIRPPSLVLLSHDHVDHTGGMPFLLQRWPEMLVSGAYGRGDLIQLDPHVRIRVLHPSRKSFLDENNRSFVLQIVFGETSLLFTGDIEDEGEDQILSRYGSFLESDVIKVAHHGSRTSSTPGMVSMTNPEWAVISAGSTNRFGHPHQEIVSRWQRAGARTWTTGERGGIWIRSDGKLLNVLFPAQ